MSGLHPRELGFATRRAVAQVGYAARLFFKLLWSLGTSLRTRTTTTSS